MQHSCTKKCKQACYAFLYRLGFDDDFLFTFSLPTESNQKPLPVQHKAHQTVHQQQQQQQKQKQKQKQAGNAGHIAQNTKKFTFASLLELLTISRPVVQYNDQAGSAKYNNCNCNKQLSLEKNIMFFPETISIIPLNIKLTVFETGSRSVVTNSSGENTDPEAEIDVHNSNSNSNSGSNSLITLIHFKLSPPAKKAFNDLDRDLTILNSLELSSSSSASLLRAEKKKILCNNTKSNDFISDNKSISRSNNSSSSSSSSSSNAGSSSSSSSNAGSSSDRRSSTASDTLLNSSMPSPTSTSTSNLNLNFTRTLIPCEEHYKDKARRIKEDLNLLNQAESHICVISGNLLKLGDLQDLHKKYLQDAKQSYSDFSDLRLRYDLMQTSAVPVLPSEAQDELLNQYQNLLEKKLDIVERPPHGKQGRPFLLHCKYIQFVTVGQVNIALWFYDDNSDASKKEKDKQKQKKQEEKKEKKKEKDRQEKREEQEEQKDKQEKQKDKQEKQEEKKENQKHQEKHQEKQEEKKEKKEKKDKQEKHDKQVNHQNKNKDKDNTRTTLLARLSHSLHLSQLSQPPLHPPQSLPTQDDFTPDYHQIMQNNPELEQVAFE